MTEQEDKKGGIYHYSETYKPFFYPKLVDLTKRHENSHWVEDEASLADDVRQWKSGELNDNDKNLITHILRLFTQSDVAVGQGYIENLLPRFKNNEVRCMLLSFAAREGVHQRAYALLNDTLGLDESEWNAFLSYGQMKDKWEYMNMKANHTKTDDGLALAKMVFLEGVSLFASFAMLLNFQRFGKMKGMSEVVEWSIRDESMHCEGNTMLFRAFCNENIRVVTDDFKKEVYDIAREIIKLEDKFIDLAFELGPVEGLDPETVKKYIRYIADRRLIQMGLKGNWKIKTIPEGMEWLSWITAGVSHKNFFEGKVTDYSVVGMSGTADNFFNMIGGVKQDGELTQTS